MLASLFRSCGQHRGRASHCRPRVDRLECRTVPSATLYVDDSLQITNDTSPAGLSPGDTVTFAPGEPGQTPGLIYGTNAFSSIQAAVNAAAPLDTVLLARGSYSLASGIMIDKSLTLQGAGSADTTLYGLAHLPTMHRDGAVLSVTGADVTVAGLTGSGFAEGLHAMGCSSLSLNDMKLPGNSAGGIISDVGSLSFTADAAHFDLGDTRLQVAGFADLTLSGVGTAHLTGGAGDNSFLVSAWTGGGSLDGGAAGLDTVAAVNDSSFVLTDASLWATDGMSLALSGFENALLLGGPSDTSFDVSGWTAGGLLSGGGGLNTVAAVKDQSFVLSDDFLFANPVYHSATGGLGMALSGVRNALLLGGTGDNAFDVTGYTGGGLLSGGAGRNIVDAKGEQSYSLTDTFLYATGGMGVVLSGVGVARLSGGAADTGFDLRGWTGSGSVNGGGGLNTVVAQTDSALVELSDLSLSVNGGLDVGMAGVRNVLLFGGPGTNRFAVTGYTGGGLISGGGGSDVLEAGVSPYFGAPAGASANRYFVVTDTFLSTDYGCTLALDGISNVQLVGGAGDDTFDVSGWTAGGVLSGGAGVNTVVAAKDANFTLTNGSLNTTGGLAVILMSVRNALLFGGPGDNTFDVSNYSGGGLLDGGPAGNDVVRAHKMAQFTLSATGLTATDGLDVMLRGIDSTDLASL